MNLTAYLNLAPEDIDYDLAAGKVAVKPEALGWGRVIYPDRETAGHELTAGRAVYRVDADLPDTAVFEVLAERDHEAGTDGRYTAGLFRSYGDAFAAADGLGVQGSRATIAVRLHGESVHENLASWHAVFDPEEASRAPEPGAREELRGLVVLAPHDPEAIGAVDPEYVIWQRLNQRYGQTLTQGVKS